MLNSYISNPLSLWNEADLHTNGAYCLESLKRCLQTRINLEGGKELDIMLFSVSLQFK